MKVKAGMADHFANVMTDEILPRLLGESGCQDAQMLIAPSGRQAIGMSLWGRRDEAENHGHTVSADVMSRLAEFLEEVAPAEVFQVWSGLRQLEAVRTGIMAPAALRAERHRVEMELGREVQRRLYPRNEIMVPGCDAAGAVVPAELMCGDYYDCFPMTGDGLGFAIGDVSGHGIGPSLIMVQTRAYLRSFSQAFPDLSEVMQRLNETLVSDLSSERFVTLLLVRLDLAYRSLCYSNAGHLPGYLLGRDGEVRVALPSTSPPLGLFGGRRMPVSPRVRLEPGDMIVLFTDGITESCSPQGEEFGAARALAVIKALRHLPAREIAAELTFAARSFAAHAQQVDDMSVFICKID
jgi:serine phosphatase RsbU (regulator of sigma subunit)